MISHEYEINSAIRENNPEALREIIDSGVDIPASLLHGDYIGYAIEQQAGVGILKLLLDAGLDFEKADRSGRTPVFKAAECGNHEVFKFLVENGADMERRDNNSLTLLMVEIQNFANPERIKILVSRGANVNARDSVGRTAMMYLVQKNTVSAETIRFLAESGADVNAVNKDGQPVFLQALKSKQFETVASELVSAGVDLGYRDRLGRTMLMMAAGLQDRNDPVFKSEEKSLAAVNFLVARGMNIHARDKSGATALTWAAMTGNSMSARALIDAGALVDSMDNDMNTPLMEAIIYDRSVDVFLNAEADVNTKNSERETPLSMAIKTSQTGMVWKLLDSGADITKSVRDGKPESVASIIKNCGMDSRDRAAIALAAAAAFWPIKSPELDSVISRNRYEGMEGLFENMPRGIPPENILSVVSRGGTKTISIPSPKKILIDSVLSVLETNPLLAVKFLKKRIGGQVDEWMKQGVENADTLVSRLAVYMRGKYGHGNRVFEDDLLF